MLRLPAVTPSSEMLQLKCGMVNYISQGAKLLINRADNLMSGHFNFKTGLLIINWNRHSFAGGPQTRRRSWRRCDKQEEETEWNRH